MNRRYALLVAGLLVTGPLVTITVNLMYNTSSEGTDAAGTVWGDLKGQTEELHTFDHPFFQAACMFAAQSVCLPAYFASQGRRSLHSHGAEAEVRLALPAACDMLGMCFLYSGLCLTYASVCEMLKCSSFLVWTALFSALFSRQTIFLFQWVALFFSSAGIVVVVAASTRDDSFSTKDPSIVLFGNLLILFAQVLAALQICAEERIVRATNGIPPLKLLGVEGVWSLFMLACLLVPMQFIEVREQPIENVPDAFGQLRNSVGLSISLILYIFGVAVYMFLGIISNEESSDATSFLVIESLRTVIVWCVSVSMGWERFRPLQLLGFVLMVFGSAVYNMVISLPLIRYPQMSPPLTEGQQETDRNSFHHNSFRRSFHG